MNKDRCPAVSRGAGTLQPSPTGRVDNFDFSAATRHGGGSGRFASVLDGSVV